MSDAPSGPRELARDQARELAQEPAREALPDPAPAQGPEPSEPDSGPRTTYLLVDGENIDATLGLSVLGHRPAPEERPRWDRVLAFAARAFDQPVKGLFFLNATSGGMPMSFVQALLAIGFRPIPLAGGPGEKVVDLGIQRTLAAIAEREGDILLASHDGDFLDDVTRLLSAPGPSGRARQVGLVGFREYVNSRFAALSTHGLGGAAAATSGLRLFDLEDDVGAFTAVLPRVRVIPLGAFDPTRYL